MVKLLLTKILQKRLNPTYNGLATSLSATAIATAITPPKMQIPTFIIPQPPIILVLQQPAQPIAIAIILPKTQTPTPITL